MSESIPLNNPVAIAEESGLVYTNSSSAQSAYILFQIKSNIDDPESLNVDLTVEGMRNEAVIPVLEKILEDLKNENQ